MVYAHTAPGGGVFAPGAIMDAMDRPAGALLRWGRALLLGCVAFAAGVLGHLSADGLMPGPTSLSLILLGCVAGSAIFLGRPASRLRVVTLLVLGQTFVHGVLTASAGHRGDPPLIPVAAMVPRPTPTLTGGERVGSLMDQFAATQPGSTQVALAVPYPVQHLIADLTGAHAVMAVAHLLAACVVGLWLAFGERALWTVILVTVERARELAAVCARRAEPSPVGRSAGPYRGERRGEDLRPRTATVLAGTVVRRGPPPALAA